MHAASIFVISAAYCVLIGLLASCAEPKGAEIFRRERCSACHSIRGAGGGAGPGLDSVGSRRTREYIIEQIKNPKSHNPNSAMPSFGYLPEEDINALADYLMRQR